MNSEEHMGRQHTYISERDQKVIFIVYQFSQTIHDNNKPELVMIKHFIDGLTTNTFRLKNNRREPIELSSASAYPRELSEINKNEIDGIQKMSEYILHEHKEFYNWPTKTFSDPINE